MPLEDHRDWPDDSREFAAKLVWEHEERYHKVKTSSDPMELTSKWATLKGNWRGVTILGVSIAAVAIVYLLTR